MSAHRMHMTVAGMLLLEALGALKVSLAMTVLERFCKPKAAEVPVRLP